ncbi:hypothetical protein [Aliarcobacter lanthieri]|uniref:hypothetical protein n=1 Tax=Aliarcobacter lanthieri TaxID=1355374 RepID=UPI000479B1D2|nr:hypothetical protein [Aliarcobacter lanthieri]
MKYFVSILIGLVLILGLSLKFQYDEKREYKNALEITINGYETSIENLEDKAKFELEMMKQKERSIKASERVKIENEKRGAIDENVNTDDNFVIVYF